MHYNVQKCEWPLRGQRSLTLLVCSGRGATTGGGISSSSSSSSSSTVLIGDEGSGDFFTGFDCTEGKQHNYYSEMS